MRILFIVDGTLDRPILHSQGLPLMRRLAEAGHICHILSFGEAANAQDSVLGQDLAERGIRWHALGVRSSMNTWGRVSVIVGGWVYAYRLCRREKMEIIHCRSYRPAMIGGLLKKLGCGRFLFDMRGFLIDEQVMLGRWKEGGLLYRSARLLERWLLLNADAIITNSSVFTQKVLQFQYMAKAGREKRIFAIPNCTDTERFTVDEETRRVYRAKMGWEERTVLAFAGEARAWEEFAGIFTFFKAFQKRVPNAFLAFFAYGDLDWLREQAQSAGMNEEAYFIQTLPPAEMPQALAACDAGILFRKRNAFTQEVVSPLKFAEYLASGLPVLVSPKVGDTAEVVERHGVGVVVDPEKPETMGSAVTGLMELLGQADIRQRCHAAAEEELSLGYAVKQYLRAYEYALREKK